MSCGGGHLGFPTGIKNRTFVEDLPMIIPGQFGFNCPSGFREEAFLVMVAILDTGRHWRTLILKGDHPRIISTKFGWDWLSSFRREDFFLISSPLFSIFSLAAILVGSRDHRTQIWKVAIQGSFHKSLVAIGPVVSEEKIYMWISHKVLC